MRIHSPTGWVDLIRTYDPRYDTLVLDPQRNGKVIDDNMFVDPIGKYPLHDKKERHYTDTNMTCSGCLGYPLYAEFDWMRVFVDTLEESGDLEWLKRHCVFRMIMGGDTTIRAVSFDAMSPVVPKGGGDALKKLIDSEKLILWPWFHALFPKIKLGPTELFRVHVTSDEVVNLKSTLRVKVFLGPWLYRQRYDKPDINERPEKPMDPE